MGSSVESPDKTHLNAYPKYEKLLPESSLDLEACI